MSSVLMLWRDNALWCCDVVVLSRVCVVAVAETKLYTSMYTVGWSFQLLQSRRCPHQCELGQYFSGFIIIRHQFLNNSLSFLIIYGLRISVNGILPVSFKTLVCYTYITCYDLKTNYKQNKKASHSLHTQSYQCVHTIYTSCCNSVRNSGG